MRKYITEKVGIVQLFQIIVTAIVLSLGYYGFSSDYNWNKVIDELGVTVCVKINREIFKANKTILFDSECPKLGFRDRNSCIPILQEKYLSSAKKDEVMTSDGQMKNISSFMRLHMKRNVVSEKSFFVVVSCIFVGLSCHLLISFIPKMSSNIKLRTKWNAALQGIVLFGSGFATVLISISANTIETSYDLVSQKIQPCSMLRYCDRLSKKSAAIDNFAELDINNALDANDACQQIYIKKAACVLLIILIGMCIAMVMMALDLTTKYEHEEGMDDEVPNEELQGGLDTLIDDEDFAFAEDMPYKEESDRVSTISAYSSMIMEPT